MKKPKLNLFLINGLLVTLVIAVTTAVFIAEIRSEAYQLAIHQQDQALRTFWQLLRRHGNDFRIVDGKLRVGEYVINGNCELPDRIREIFGGAATVFMGDERVSTNILSADGRRAIGTRLQGPAFDAIFHKHLPYRGEAPILGIPYFTAYDPIVDRDGRTVGVLFVGVKKSEFLVGFHHLRTNVIAASVVIELLFLALGFVLLWERGRYEARLGELAGTLQTQLSFLQTLIDTIPSPIFYKDRAGRYLGHNKAFGEFLGLGGVIGKSVYEVAPADLAQGYFEKDEELFNDPGVQVYDASVVYADGSRHDVIFNKATFTDGEGMVAGLVGVVLDVTERKRAEDALRESEERFHQLFAQNVDGIVLFTPDDRQIIDANTSAQQLTGYSLGELTRLTLGAIIDADIDTKAADGAQLGKGTCTRKDGSMLFVSIWSQLIMLRDRSVVYCSLRDITEKSRLQEEVRATQAKLIHANKMTSLGLLASSVAHEINNPNNCVAVNAAVLTEVWRDAEPVLQRYREEHGEFALRGIPFGTMRDFAPQLFTGISESSRRISAIVSNMTTCVREDKSGLRGAIDINKLAESAAGMLWHHIHRHTDSFQLALAAGLPAAHGNGQQIEQVIINLLVNALQALPDKRCGVQVATGHDPETGTITVTVRDEGSGIAPADLARLREPFFTTRHGGTGLGLYISSAIIEEHGGTLAFDSAHGRGTTVTVRIPERRRS